MTVVDRDRVARAGDDALDEVHVRALRRSGGSHGWPVAPRAAPHVSVSRPVGRVEDDDVADVGVAEAVPDPVDEHALADLERRHHRLATGSGRA